MPTKRPQADPAASTPNPEAQPADAAVEGPITDETTAPIPVGAADATRAADPARRVLELARALTARMRARRPRSSN